jgi:PAS domain S-box-containing protein
VDGYRSQFPGSVRFFWLRFSLGLAAIVLFSLIVFLVGIESSVRAYIRGEGLWSKGQKGAAFSLAEYALLRDEDNYKDFERSIVIPLGDHLARLEMQKAEPDYSAVRRGLIEGGNHPDDIDGMVKLFRRFHAFPYMSDAIDIWTRADIGIEQLGREGTALHRRMKEGNIDPAGVAEAVRRLETIDESITPLELAFSSTLGDASRALTRAQIACVALEGLLLLTLAAITSRRRLDTLRYLLRQIREREARFDAFMRNIPALTFIKDEAGEFTWMNSRFEQIVAQQRASGPGQVDFSHLSEQERVAHAAVLERDEPVEVMGGSIGENDGERSWLMIKFPVDEEGGRRLVGSIAVDVTQLRHLENELERATRVSSLGSLATMVAHEFNNVLMGILPFAQYLRKSSNGNEQQTRAADYISKAVSRGKRITDQILTYGHLVEPSLQDIALETWLLEFQDSTRDILRAGVHLELDLSRAPLKVCVDPAQLHQALLNLLTNANDAMHEGGTMTIVALSHPSAPRSGMLPADCPYVELIFRDHGAGIAPDVREHIFEPLFTTKRGGGTGLGLAVVHQVVTGHHGHISVDSVVGRGTAFHLFLPQPSGVSNHPRGEVETVPLLPAERLVVLLVEDDMTVASALVVLFESLGASVTHVSEGKAVPSALAARAFDVVVLDIALGDMDGTEVYRHLRVGHPGLPVLFSTGHATEATMTAIGRDAHTAWLLKPYGAEDFLTALSHVRGS